MHRTGMTLRGYQRTHATRDAAWASHRLEAVSPQNGELLAGPYVGECWPGAKGRTVRAPVECTCATAGPPASRRGLWKASARSVRAWRVAPAIGADFGDHQTLGAVAVAHEHVLTGPEFGD